MTEEDKRYKKLGTIKIMDESGYKQLDPLFGHDEEQLLYRIDVYKHASDKSAPDRFLTEDEREVIQLTPNTFQIVGTNSFIKTQEKYPYQSNVL
jgi:hypothetical protein